MGNYIWIKYSGNADGTDLTDNVMNYTYSHSFSSYIGDISNTSWNEIILHITPFTGTLNLSNIKIQVEGFDDNYYTGSDLSFNNISDTWQVLPTRNKDNLKGKNVIISFNYIVLNHTSKFYFDIMYNNEENIPTNNQNWIYLNTAYKGIATGKDTTEESENPQDYTWYPYEGESESIDSENNITMDDPLESGEEYQDSTFTPIPTGGGDTGIESGSEDSWGNENYGLPCALYFYYMGDDINAGNEYENWNTEYTNAVLGNCSAIQSVQYVPFLRKDDLNLLAVPYDVARFGQLQASHPKLDYAPYVYRIKALSSQVKTLGSFIPYKPTKTIGGERNWRNESRLYNYPYNFAMITDHLNPPMEIKYHLVPNNKGDIKVLQTMSDRCSYGIYVEGYKGDNGQLEAMVSGEAHELPCSSSAYNQWYASNKNQIAQNVSNMSQTAFLNNQNISQNQQYNILNSTVGAIGNAISMNWGGVANSVIGGFQNNMNMNFQKQMNNVGVQQQIAMNMAQGQDMRNTPNTMISMGSDVYYGLAKGNYQLDLYRFGLTEEYNRKLGDYFAMYGYKQNMVMTINTQDRYYYNYIKTVGVNIEATNIPRNHLEEIKSIFDNGVTIWHTFREGVTVGDISKDNKEV